jgi:hypothetical protein
MGNLSEPLNTFWQLLFEPSNGGSWSDQVQATAVATNGGVVLGASQSGALVAGVLPSNLLHYSPLIATTDAGASWSNGLLTEGLAAQPDALAVESSAKALALVAGPAGAEVLASSGDLANWDELTDTQQLAGTAAASGCGLRAITAVAYDGASPAVGGACGTEGTGGVFVLGAHGWQSAGLGLPAGEQDGHAEVLALRSTATGLAVLVAVSGQGSSYLVAGWRRPSGTWAESSPLRVGPGTQLMSLGPAAGAGLFVLSGTSSGTRRLEVVTPGGAWRQLPGPPAGTATVAFGDGTTIDALCVAGPDLTVWRLVPSSGKWVRIQVMYVVIPYGSSS